jgi:hypothetical protein
MNMALAYTLQASGQVIILRGEPTGEFSHNGRRLGYIDNNGNEPLIILIEDTGRL